MELLLATIFIFLAIFEGWFTEHRLLVMGDFIELSKPLRWFGMRFGLATSLILLQVLPAVALCGLFTWLHWTLPLTLLLGMRVQAFIGQLKTLEVEADFIKKVNEFRANQKPPKT